METASWCVIASVLLSPFPGAVSMVMAEQAPRPPVAVLPATASRAVEAVAEPNRTAPRFERATGKIVISEQPSEQELFRLRLFAEPLVPVGKSSAEENKALGAALRQYVARQGNEDVSALVEFMKAHPDSAWRVALLTDLGIVYRKTGYFSKALEAWEEAWKMGKAEKSPNGRAIVDRAVGELVELNARVGRFERLEALFAELDSRAVRGPATEKIAGGKQGLWLMRNKPQDAFRCGPMALDRIRASINPNLVFDTKIRQSRSTTNGMSLAQVRDLALDLKMDYEMVKRPVGGKVVVPSVVHWKVGHYAALVKEQNGRYLVQDPTFTDDIWVSKAALDEEGTGFFLVPKQQIPEGWAKVDLAMAETVWGKGNVSSSDNRRIRRYDTKVPDCPDQGTPMAQYAIHAMLVSLNIVDTPVGYTPPRGRPVFFEVTYNHRDAGQPSIFNYSNLGPKWTFGWLSYITDDPDNTSADVETYLQGGGAEVSSGYDSSTGNYAPQKESFVVIARTSSSSYERRLPDGSKQIFDLPDGATDFPRKVLLTKEIDPMGSVVTYSYDTNYCLVDIADAIGQHTTISYDLPGDPYKITKVTDPFGRFATFDYNGDGQLRKITDIIGIQSEFTYSSGDFINSLKTPYGTTTFIADESGTYRYLEATDPLGQKERVEYRHEAPGILASEPENNVPVGIDTPNLFLNYRNTFYWNKKAMQMASGDYTKAKLFHFLHTPDLNQASGIIESEKNPLERRVWRNYPGQSVGLLEGTSGKPSKIARVLDDGSTQMVQFEYNDLGKVTKAIDPVGRTSLYVYSTNQMDLLEVRQVVGETNELLGTFTYNAQHLPLTSVNASGLTNYFTYNTNGQVTVVSNSFGQSITTQYDTNGYLTNITDHTSGLSSRMTYDSYGRIRTTTDSEGYTLTMEYDAADRLTKMTFPDGTHQTIVYKNLDPVFSRDRRGIWMQSSYDALRRVTYVRDSLNRITHFEWCGCGALESITDPMGRITTWMRDLQGRVTAKVYPDRTTMRYAYETNSSRLKYSVDARLQLTKFEYFVDGNTKQISYENTVNPPPAVSYTYDTNYSRLLTMTDGIGTTAYAYYSLTNGLVAGAGRLAAIDGPLNNDTITYQYDGLGRITNQALNGVGGGGTFDFQGRVTTYTNGLGVFTNSYVLNFARLSSVVYPNGQTVSYSYYGATNDTLGKSILNRDGAATVLSKFDYTYDAEGQIQTWTQQAGTISTNVYSLEHDPVDQLVGATLKIAGTAGALLKQFVYRYDNMGNRTVEQVGNAVATANYNAINQLTNTAGGGVVRFKGSLNETGSVTVAGNLATMSGQTNFTGYAMVNVGTNVIPVVAVDLSGNQRTNSYQMIVTSNGLAKTLVYDINGNLTSSSNANGVVTYGWDGLDQLVGITNGTHVSEFYYDGQGRRVRIVEKESGTNTSDKRFVWVGGGLAEERDASGNVTKRFFGKGEQIGGTNYFFTFDHLGSVREMTDASGAVRARYDYDPYGRTVKMSGDMEADFGYAGHYRHVGSGLYLAPYRAYDPETGRWLSRDPSEEAGGLNLYAYVSNNPITRVDPDGLREVESVTWNEVADMIDGRVQRGVTYFESRNADMNFQIYNLQSSITMGTDMLRAGTDTAQALNDPCLNGWQRTGKVLQDGLRLVGLYGLLSSGLKSGAKSVIAECTGDNCFVAGTPVAVEEGEKPIEEIKVGDKVWAYDEASGEVVLQEVAQTYIRHVEEGVQVSIGTETVVATPEHPFWVENRGWVEAGKLKTGDKLEVLDGKPIPVAAAERVTGFATVYNFEVTGAHSYYVAKAKLLVHNANYSGGAAKMTKDGGRLTEPNLPPKTIVEKDGVQIVHYTKSGDHGPPHLHVIGEGAETKIGQAGKPIDGSPELSAAQKKVVESSKSGIRKAVDQIGRYFRFNNQ